MSTTVSRPWALGKTSHPAPVLALAAEEGQVPGRGQAHPGVGQGDPLIALGDRVQGPAVHGLALSVFSVDTHSSAQPGLPQLLQERFGLPGRGEVAGDHPPGAPVRHRQPFGAARPGPSASGSRRPPRAGPGRGPLGPGTRRWGRSPPRLSHQMRRRSPSRRREQGLALQGLDGAAALQADGHLQGGGLQPHPHRRVGLPGGGNGGPGEGGEEEGRQEWNAFLDSSWPKKVQARLAGKAKIFIFHSLRRSVMSLPGSTPHRSFGLRIPELGRGWLGVIMVGAGLGTVWLAKPRGGGPGPSGFPAAQGTRRDPGAAGGGGSAGRPGGAVRGHPGGVPAGGRGADRGPGARGRGFGPPSPWSPTLAAPTPAPRPSRWCPGAPGPRRCPWSIPSNPGRGCP